DEAQPPSLAVQAGPRRRITRRARRGHAGDRRPGRGRSGAPDARALRQGAFGGHERGQRRREAEPGQGAGDAGATTRRGAMSAIATSPPRERWALAPASDPVRPAPLRSCDAARAAPAGARTATPTAAPRTTPPAP